MIILESTITQHSKGYANHWKCLIDNKIKPFDSNLFSSNGKLKSGEEAIHKFFENQLGEVALLHKKVKKINSQLTELIPRKVLSTFEGSCPKPKRRKHKQKKDL